MKVRLCDELEEAWTKIQQDLSVGATPNYIYKTGDIEVIISVSVIRDTPSISNTSCLDTLAD